MRLSYLRVLLLILLPIILYFQTRGLNFGEEGRILLSAEKLLQSKEFYFDSYFFISPLSVLSTAVFFELFGVSVLSLRILITAVSIVSSFLVFRIVKLSTRNTFYSTIATLIFFAWGPLHLTFTNTLSFALMSVLLTVFFLLKFLETRKNRYLVVAGIASFLVFISYYLIGILLLFPVLLFFLVKSSRRIEYILSFVYGYIWALIFFTVFMLFTDSFGSFFYIMVKAIDDQGQNTLKGLNFASKYGIFVSTISVVILPATFLLLFIRRRFHLLFIPFVSGIFFIGNPVPLIGILLVLYLRYNISSTLRMALLLIAFFLMFLGFRNAYLGKTAYGELYSYHTFYDARVKLFISEELEKELNSIKNIVIRHDTGDEIYIASENYLLYFVFQKPDPIERRFFYFSENEYNKMLLGNLVAKKIRTLFVSKNQIHNPQLDAYISKNYKLEKRLKSIDYYVRLP